MRYRISIRLAENSKYTYSIDAKDEEEALQRLKLRLPPHQRESIIVDAVSIDPASIGSEDPYGIFGGE